MRALLPSLGSIAVGASIAMADIKSDGAFGFPQKSATVLCDTEELRLAAASDGMYLFVQAVLWKDTHATEGLTDDGRKIGDNSVLAIDVDADGKKTKDVDRSYSLDPWPSRHGLHYSVVLGGGATTGLQGDSKGRGSIQYIRENDGHVRVDTYFIPLVELGRKADEQVKLAFWAKSAEPPTTWNSVGFTPKEPAKPYYSHHLPIEKWHDVSLKAIEGSAFDAEKVPEGRGAIAINAKKGMPKVGTRVGEADGPPEVDAQAWKNWKGEKSPTLADLKGKVVVVEFWATWCAPCVAGIPHLNELHKQHERDGLVILSLTDQEKTAIAKFVDAKGDKMAYPIGMGSESTESYGVSGIPHAFIIGRDGKLAWEGNPHDKEFDGKIESALKEK